MVRMETHLSKRKLVVEDIRLLHQIKAKRVEYFENALSSMGHSKGDKKGSLGRGRSSNNSEYQAEHCTIDYSGCRTDRVEAVHICFDWKSKSKYVITCHRRQVVFWQETQARDEMTGVSWICVAIFESPSATESNAYAQFVAYPSSTNSPFIRILGCRKISLSYVFHEVPNVNATCGQASGSGILPMLLPRPQSITLADTTLKGALLDPHTLCIIYGANGLPRIVVARERAELQACSADCPKPNLKEQNSAPVLSRRCNTVSPVSIYEPASLCESPKAASDKSVYTEYALEERLCFCSHTLTSLIVRVHDVVFEPMFSPSGSPNWIVGVAVSDITTAGKLAKTNTQCSQQNACIIQFWDVLSSTQLFQFALPYLSKHSPGFDLRLLVLPTRPERSHPRDRAVKATIVVQGVFCGQRNPSAIVLFGGQYLCRDSETDSRNKCRWAWDPGSRGEKSVGPSCKILRTGSPRLRDDDVILYSAGYQTMLAADFKRGVFTLVDLVGNVLDTFAAVHARIVPPASTNAGGDENIGFEEPTTSLANVACTGDHATLACFFSPSKTMIIHNATKV